MNPIAYPIRNPLPKAFATDRDKGRDTDIGRDRDTVNEPPPFLATAVHYAASCDDCGTTLGELCESKRFRTLLCFGCYQRRHRPRPVSRKPRAEVRAELARIGKAWRDGDL